VVEVGKKKELSDPDLAACLSAFIDRHKAGSPTDPDVYWIHLKPKEIAAQFAAETGQTVSHGMVKRSLKSKGFGYRKQLKSLPIGSYAKRDEQFKIIFMLAGLMSPICPIISIDCKKKERIGNLYRSGKLYCTSALKVFDHDYHYLSKGVVIPHGIWY